MVVLSRWRAPDPRKVDFHCRLIFTCVTHVNEIEAIFGRSRLHLKVQPRYAGFHTSSLAYSRVNYTYVRVFKKRASHRPFSLLSEALIKYAAEFSEAAVSCVNLCPL